MTGHGAAADDVEDVQSQAAKTRADVEALKRAWLQDPAWDIEDTIGFEAYRHELVAFNDDWRARWADERDAAARRTPEAVADRLGVLGEELLAEFKRLNARLDGVADQPRDGAVSSIAIEDMAKGPPKITTKLYAHDPLTREQIDQALEAHGYAHREAERRALDGWLETTNGVKAES